MNSGVFWLKEAEELGQELAEIADNLSSLCATMVRFQIAADTLLKKIKEALPEEEIAGFRGAAETVAAYEPGPPRALALVLPDAPPRLEVYWGAWPGAKAYAEVRDHWRSLVRAALERLRLAGCLPEKPLSRAAAFFTFYVASSQPWDVDNYSMRFIINALRRERVLLDDTFDRLTIAARGVQAAPSRTEVILVECPEWPFQAVLTSEVGRKLLPKLEINPAAEAARESDFLLE